MDLTVVALSPAADTRAHHREGSEGHAHPRPPRQCPVPPPQGRRLLCSVPRPSPLARASCIATLTRAATAVSRKGTRPLHCAQLLSRLWHLVTVGYAPCRCTRVPATRTRHSSPSTSRYVLLQLFVAPLQRLRLCKRHACLQTLQSMVACRKADADMCFFAISAGQDQQEA